MFKLYRQYDEHRKVTCDFAKPSLTDSSFKDECDIHFILNNFVRTGKLPNEGQQLVYGDSPSADAYMDAQMLVAECKSSFEALPSKIRDEFQTVNNYLSYISDPNNLKDAYERELIDRDTVDLKDVYPEQYKVVEPSVTPDEPEKPDTKET